MSFQNNNSHYNNRPKGNYHNGNTHHSGNGSRNSSYKSSNRVFTHFATAPYNFVSYDNQNLLGPSSDKELYSGTIECTLKALTPLLVASSTEKTDNKGREFLKLDNGKLVIPGSSLKGMVRSYVEALSRSAISIINDNRVFYRNVTEKDGSDYKRLGNFPKQGEKILGGFIKPKGSKYKIYPADVRKVEDGEKVNPQDCYKTGKFKGKARIDR